MKKRKIYDFIITGFWLLFFSAELEIDPQISDQYFADDPKNCVLYTDFARALSFCETGNICENFLCETQTTVMRYELYLGKVKSIHDSPPINSN